MMDGRRLEKSPYLSNALTDLDEIWQDYAEWVSRANLPLNDFQKFKMAADAILKKR